MGRWLVSAVLMMVALAAPAQRQIVQAHSPQTGIPTEAWADVEQTPKGVPTYTTREMRIVHDPMTGFPREAWVDVVRPVPGAAEAIAASRARAAERRQQELQAQYQQWEPVPQRPARSPSVSYTTPNVAESPAPHYRQQPRPSPPVLMTQQEMVEQALHIAALAEAVRASGQQPMLITHDAPKEQSLVIDGRNFDPMALESNRIAHAEENGGRDACDRQWESSMARIPEGISLDRSTTMARIYSHDRVECYAAARAAE